MSPRWQSPSSWIPRVAGASVVVLGALVLLGWFFDIEAFKSVIPGSLTMGENAALLFILSGAALWFLAHGRSSPARVLSLIVVAVAGATLLEFDMGLNTAVSFLSLGIALTWAGSARKQLRLIAQWLALAAMAIAALPIIGYAYGIMSLAGVGVSTRMPINTAIAFQIVCIGVVHLHPDEGFASIVNSRGPGGLVARKLLPAIVLGPFLVGWLRLEGQRAGLYGTELGVVILVVSTTVVLGAILLTHARGIDSADGARRAAASDVRENEARMRFVLSSARVSTWDFSFDQDHVVWSDTTRAFFGYGTTQAPRTGKEFVEFIHPDDRVVVIESAQRAFAGRSDFAMDFRVLWGDGSIHWIDCQARAFHDAAGRPTKLTGAAFDTTHRRLLEGQVHQAQKLEAIGHLAGGVAHDFNNVLTAILGYTELLLSDMSPDRPERMDLEEIRRASERAGVVTQQLLAFSRRQFLQPRVLNLNALVVDSQRMLMRLVPEHVVIGLHLKSDIGRVKADPTQIEQVLLNLVVNARDAMPRGGTLSIETADTTLEAGRRDLGEPVVPGEYVLLTVTDTGIGMTADIQRQIFDPFFTTKTVGEGNGLLLATAYGIVRQSAGYISVESEPGRGSSFKVYLPRVFEEPVTSNSHEARVVTHYQGIETILVAEDEDGVRVTTRRILENLGYCVLDACSHAEALERARAHAGRIDLLLSDVIMPESGSTSLFDQLVLERRDLRVLYMSGYADETVFQQGLFIESQSFLKKPFGVTDLAQAVRKILDVPTSSKMRTD